MHRGREDRDTEISVSCFCLIAFSISESTSKTSEHFDSYSGAGTLKLQAEGGHLLTQRVPHLAILFKDNWIPNRGFALSQRFPLSGAEHIV